ENLAIDFTQAEDVVSAWLASPKHKENMLRADYTETGVAVLSGEFKGATSIIVVHMFGKPLTTLAVASPVPTVAPAVQASVAPTPPITTILQAKTFIAKATVTPTPEPSITPTPEPAKSPEIISAILSPSFDAEEFAIAGATTWQLFSAQSNIAVDADVISAIPLFTIHPASNSATVFGATISRISRDFIGIILLAITAMLILTILVKIKIQHPIMIGHASLVILLAFALFLA
ncbi:MAG: CAP domain-containing protein, partial [Candidatus Andersenbacteria bacterium]